MSKLNQLADFKETVKILTYLIDTQRWNEFLKITRQILTGVNLPQIKVVTQKSGWISSEKTMDNMKDVQTWKSKSKKDQFAIMRSMVMMVYIMLDDVNNAARVPAAYQDEWESARERSESILNIYKVAESLPNINRFLYILIATGTLLKLHKMGYTTKVTSLIKEKYNYWKNRLSDKEKMQIKEAMKNETSSIQIVDKSEGLPLIESARKSSTTRSKPKSERRASTRRSKSKSAKF